MTLTHVAIVWYGENMPYCIVFGCSNSTDRFCPGISFHRLPMNDSRRLKEWLNALKLVNPPIHYVNARVCSEHFASSYFLTRMQESITVKRLLSKDAVPTTFPYSAPAKRCTTSEIWAEQKQSKDLVQAALQT